MKYDTYIDSTVYVYVFHFHWLHELMIDKFFRLFLCHNYITLLYCYTFLIDVIFTIYTVTSRSTKINIGRYMRVCIFSSLVFR